MSKLVPLILELDEPLGEGEEFVGVKTVGIDGESGWVYIGYVGIIKNTRQRLDIRYGNLKAVKYDKSEINDKVL